MGPGVLHPGEFRPVRRGLRRVDCECPKPFPLWEIHVSSQSLFEAELNHAPPAAERASWRARLTASVFAGRFDDTLAFGGTAASGTALGVHADRLRSECERRSVARVLRHAVREAHGGRPLRASTVPFHRVNIVAAETVIDAIALRMYAPAPVSAMGMARLRRLLADGSGPMYAGGPGDLEGRLRAVLAVL